ncbi:MAG TPA: hypothetical protein PK357_02875 [Candidatus Pacearchaeota archaeon]|nr:hypothetical protein [Candidatus Pacearchaeota archaeon]
MPIEFEYTEDTDSDEEDDDEEEEDDDEEIEEEIEGNIEEIEFDMSEEEIDEWINELIILKEEQKSINLQIDNDLFLKINYVEEEQNDTKY